MKLIAIALLAAAAFAQEQKTIPDVSKMAAGGAPAEATPSQFSHEQKDALRQAALEMIWTHEQVAAEIARLNERKAAADAAYAKLQNELLTAIKACPSAAVDLQMNVSCPPGK